MDRLVADTDLLRETGASLRFVENAFDSAEADASAAAEAVAHGAFGARLRDFATNWSATREKTLEVIKGLGESAVAVGNAFDQVDQELANSLTNPQAVTPGNNPSNGNREAS